MWFKSLWNWFIGKKDKDLQKERIEKLKELEEALPEKPILKAPPPPPIRKGTLQDIRAYTEEARKTIWILKKALNDHYVELGNLKDKIDGLIERME